MAAAARQAPPRPLPGEKRATFRYEIGGQDFPIPLVRATVAGKPTWMLVDTGSASHVLAGWLARKAGLALKKRGDRGADHAGRTIAEFRVENPRMAIDGWGAVTDTSMIATEVPQFYEDLGIGGFVSPQQLVQEEGGAVVVDLGAGEMRAARYDEALHKLGRRGSSLAPDGVSICEDDANPIQGLVFVIPAAVEGRKVSLLVDTGAQRSDLLASSDVGKALSPRSVPNKLHLYAASGPLTSRTLRGATIRAGDFAVRSDIDLIPGAADPYCPRDGVISMDVLRACVLVLGKNAMAGRCGVR